LECEKASVCAQLESVVLRLQQQHQAELAQLEERLRDFYSAEWDKAHQVYQEEADRCTVLMRQQVEEVKSKQEALRTEQEVAHSRQIEELRQGYETMLAELRKSHERDRQDLDNTHKSSEAAFDQQHQAELAQLEERLRDFYSAEWDKAHQVYQEEADRCTVLMRQQVEEVKSKQEALRTEQEVAHSRQIEELRQGYETMLA
ncbi:microtubule-associated tumor suppressor 1 homolog, partial [Tachysurus ichikawai]